MKTAILQRYGSPDHIIIDKQNKPEPDEHEVQIEVIASTVTSGDVKIRSMDFPKYFWLPMRLIFGFRTLRKSILGIEFSGIISKTGSAVSKYQVGDHVYGSTGIKTGSTAEYICLKEDGAFTHKPDNLTFAQAAAVSIGVQTAKYFLEQAGISSGDKVLIYGASGSVGSYAVQLAKIMGAEVTGVCSTKNIDTVRGLGADHVIDYMVSNFTDNDSTYDVIYDTQYYEPI